MWWCNDQLLVINVTLSVTNGGDTASFCLLIDVTVSVTVTVMFIEIVSQ